MPQYLYRIRPTRPEMLLDSTPNEDRATEAHFTYLQELADRGTVLLAGRTLNTDPTAFGIVLFEAESDEEASRIMHADPAVAADVFRADLFPYRIALLSDRILS